MAVQAPPVPERRTAPWPISFYRTAVGKKVVMALTGIVGFGYVLAHMLGNLKIYLGESSLNHYAEWLRELGVPALPRGGFLWLGRAVLVVALILHVHAAWSLARISNAARPSGYAKQDYVAANYASRTMRWGGVIVLLFIIWHLLDLTGGQTNPDFVRGEVYANVVASFERWPVAVFYIIANLALGLHLYHGLWSLFQTLGWTHTRFDPVRRKMAIAFALLVTAGNVSFPLAVMTGAIG